MEELPIALESATPALPDTQPLEPLPDPASEIAKPVGSVAQVSHHEFAAIQSYGASAAAAELEPTMASPVEDLPHVADPNVEFTSAPKIDQLAADAAPGFEPTVMEMDDSGSFLAMLERTIPMGRLGVADDVARLALFLAGDGSAYTTGAVIPCDGGLAAFR